MSQATSTEKERIGFIGLGIMGSRMAAQLAAAGAQVTAAEAASQRLDALISRLTMTAPRAGTVVQIMIEDGTPVEFGEPLMIIE